MGTGLMSRAFQRAVIEAKVLNPSPACSSIYPGFSQENPLPHPVAFLDLTTKGTPSRGHKNPTDKAGKQIVKFHVKMEA